MAPMHKSLGTLALSLLLLPVVVIPCWAGGQAGSTPTARIPVAPLGFVAPNPAYLHERLSFVTLDFLDPGHLLFTFHVNRLLPRIPGDPPDDDDQIIHAVVLEIRSGKVLRAADWRMHDRGRYLWALRDRNFLVRVRNSLFFTDRNLALKPYLTPDTALQGVEVSAGRGLLMLEVEETLPATGKAGGDKDEATAPSLLSESGEKPKVRTRMVLVHPGERDALGWAEMRTPQYIPLLEDGILGVDEGKGSKDWVIAKRLLDKKRVAVGTVKSSCAPQLVLLSKDVVLSRGCPEHGGSGNEVRAIALKNGRVLWGDYWQSKYIWPQIRSSEDGSRFAYESLEMNRDIGTLDVFGHEAVEAQPVGVFDTKTGNLVLVKDASPVLSAGQNFALSADGRRFAILRDGAIEVYDLPPVVAAPVKNGSVKTK